MKIDKILLAGASGYLGTHIAEELKNRSIKTKLIVRNSKRLSYDTRFFEIQEAQLTQPESVKGICRGINVVISTVGITRQKDGLTYMNVDFQANMHLLEDAISQGVNKFIYIANLNGQHLRHLKICEAKELFVDQLQKSGMDYCIIRPNGFFSDMAEFYKMAQKGKVQLFGDGNWKTNPIHGKDLARLCVDSITSPEKTIAVGGPEILTHNEIARLAYEIMGTEPRISYTPDWMRRAILWLMRTFTSSKTYGPAEFMMTVLAMDMIAPVYGDHTLKSFFREIHLESQSGKEAA